MYFKYYVTVLLMVIPEVIHSAYAWGFFAHESINHLAVYTLDPELFGFYKKHTEYIVRSSVNPDKRRYLVDSEGARHYIDVDQYEKELPLDTIRWGYDSLCNRFGIEHVQEHGIAPWNILWMQWRLTEAFRNRDVHSVLKLSAEIGHYISDLHVPLHTTSNYNGQKTGQEGIHALWESRLPELFFSNYWLFSGTAVYLPNIKNVVYDILEESHRLSQIVLWCDKQVRESIPSHKYYTIELRKGKSIKTYSLAYRKEYHRLLGEMVENRMRDSIHIVGSIWKTCWIDAGQPDMKVDVAFPEFDTIQITASDSLKVEQKSGRKAKSRIDAH